MIIMLSQDTKFKWLVFSLILVTILEFLSLSGWDLPPTIAIPLFLVIILSIGHHALLEGFRALFHVNFKSINLLMTISVIAAFYLEKYAIATIIIVLYNLSEKLEDFWIQKNKESLRNLIEQLPKTALVKGESSSIPVSQVKIDDILMIKPGEIIPLDGKILFGFTTVDESSITGELIPKHKGEKDLVFAGSLNIDGYIEIGVIRLIEDITLAKIKRITFQNKTHDWKFNETFSIFYTPVVLFLALLLMTISHYFLLVPFNQSFLQALSFLVIACPCALVICAPISIYSAIGNAMSKGILIKDGWYLEALGKINAIALDKTRTLTGGDPIITDIIPFGAHTKEHLLSCAEGIGIQSEHPFIKNIIQTAKKEEYTSLSLKDLQIEINKDDQIHCLVCKENQHYLKKLESILDKHKVTKEVIEKIDNLEKEGKIVLIICTHNEVQGVIGLLDNVRPESKRSVQNIKNLGVTPVMLTGDNRKSADAIAKMLNIFEVKANLLPEDKAIEIENLLSKYKYVAMVGDGINDAPALARSTVGISMGEFGNAIAIEAASIVILNNYLNRIPFLISLGRKTLQTITINRFLAIGIKVIFIILALFGMGYLRLAIFADVVVAIIATLNSLKLSKELFFLKDILIGALEDG
jgi:Zn2+/Cd2+-exporting ATPase